METKIKLTQYSHGAGCGCKISPKILSNILQSDTKILPDKKLIVGNDTKDDAAVYDIGNNTAVISTTDFFLPIVDDPFTFGKIAATNAISDVYAMGGKPILAIAILGWPINKIPAEIAGKVMEGGRAACKEAGIVLAGGHSIDNPEPLFGLAVTGQVELNKLKRNDTAKAGSVLYLTKPLGIGILSTAQKKGILKSKHKNIGPESMMRLNNVGLELAENPAVSSMTDVTGFGFLGHLLEMCEGSNVSAEIDFSAIPIFPEVIQYIKEGSIPGGTTRNWDSYGDKIGEIDSLQKHLLCDPQTSGGLLIAVDASESQRIEKTLEAHKLYSKPIGRITEQKDKIITLQP